ncbi:DUF2802 domain-containing protein [Rheinheimera maricola]|uniref:DUF2802 domain-containing protein n=1 Tax=Rheinheimera maricola TaxID=2793282 RepID=A0ABS7X3X0_9GAMM|nr:DUF2802 domain-containing protein [Rheinheimera maricola]MBZ9610256.1 DUF2802 domain-containing protein [Rheinheimera maricola]
MTLPVYIGLLLLAILACAAALYWWFARMQRSLQEKWQQFEQQLDYQAQQLQQSRHELEELRSGVIGVGQRVLQLDSSLSMLSQQLGALADKQQALELVDPESKIYSRAMKMVQLGADLDEIMRECELPQAEAELLFNLHQTKT